MLKMMSLVSILLVGVMLFSGCVMDVQAPGPDNPVVDVPVVDNPIVDKPLIVEEIKNEKSGFNDYSSFFRSYKKVIGISPSEDIKKSQS